MCLNKWLGQSIDFAIDNLENNIKTFASRLEEEKLKEEVS
jgi:hypothetical protein